MPMFLEVANSADAIFEQAKQRLPAGTQIQVMESGAVFIEGTINNLTNTSSLTGGALVSLIVFLFLRRIGPTLIIASAIPLSIIVTFLAVYALGFTLNSVTLIALSLSVGMVVDNGVVALENISRKIDEGMDRFQAAHEGAAEVGGALLCFNDHNVGHLCPHDVHCRDCGTNVRTTGCRDDRHHLRVTVCRADRNTHPLRSIHQTFWKWNSQRRGHRVKMVGEAVRPSIDCIHCQAMVYPHLRCWHRDRNHCTSWTIGNRLPA